MDHEAMEILRKGGREGTGKEFRKYLKRTGVSSWFVSLTNSPTDAVALVEHHLRQEPDFSVARHHGSSRQDLGRARRDCLCAIRAEQSV